MKSLTTYFYTASMALTGAGVLLHIILSIWKAGFSKNLTEHTEEIKVVKRVIMWCIMLAATIFIIAIYLDYKCV